MSTNLLEQVIAKKIWLGCVGRYEALQDIKLSIDTSSPFVFAETYGVLVNETAEYFMIEFMAVFNEEVRPHY